MRRRRRELSPFDWQVMRLLGAIAIAFAAAWYHGLIVVGFQ